jgi:hypothetical protein
VKFRTYITCLALATLNAMGSAAATPSIAPGEPEPAYVDWYMSIAKATRTNLKLCKATR